MRERLVSPTHSLCQAKTKQKEAKLCHPEFPLLLCYRLQQPTRCVHKRGSISSRQSTWLLSTLHPSSLHRHSHGWSPADIRTAAYKTCWVETHPNLEWIAGVCVNSFRYSNNLLGPRNLSAIAVPDGKHSFSKEFLKESTGNRHVTRLEHLLLRDGVGYKKAGEWR